MNKFEKLQYKYNRDAISGLEENSIVVNGKAYDSDFLGLIRIAVLIAKEVGMGGCKTLTEFVNMIDQEDHVLLDAFSFELSMLNACRNADDKELKDQGEPDELSFEEEVEIQYPENSTHIDLNTAPKHSFEQHGRRHKKEEPKVEDKANTKTSKPVEGHKAMELQNSYQKNLASNVKIENYILNHGGSKKEMNEYREKVDSGKIKIPNYDFSGITTNGLVNSSPEDFKALLGDMDNYKGSGKNFKMQLSDFGKQKE